MTSETAVLNGKPVAENLHVRGQGMDLAAIAETVGTLVLTFVLGILPMVWATGAGANARRSIGVTTLAGMLAATLVGVLLVPGLYVIFQRIGDWYERHI